MDNEKFKEALLKLFETKQYADQKKCKELIKITKFSFDQTTEYTRNKWDHYKEHLYLYIEPTLFNELNCYNDLIEEMCRKTYPNDTGYELCNIDIKPNLQDINIDPISVEMRFDEIESTIIEKLSSAKYCIWVAMAWFTNEKIYEVLLKKKKEGLNIRLILDDNNKNKRLDFSEFEHYYILIESKYKNIMHNKFCIIDMKMVLHGTYNWTNAANYNMETCETVKGTKEVEKFADWFVNMVQDYL